MTKYGSSPGSIVPKSRVPVLPRQRGPLQSDVVVIGGGLTGCATAYAFAVAGVKVVLVEAAQIGRGNSGSSAGWISEDPGIAFTDLEKALGRRGARRAWQGWRRAALDFAALLRRLRVKCDLEARPAMTVAVTPDQLARLTREYQARRKGGLDCAAPESVGDQEELGLDATAGLRAKDGATVNPYRACLGLRRGGRSAGANALRALPGAESDVQSQDRRSGSPTAAASRRRVVVATGCPRRSTSRSRDTLVSAPPSRADRPVPAKIRRLAAAANRWRETMPFPRTRSAGSGGIVFW